jgi:probable O-glycosylation ligase (exosortase A-associated)
MLGLIFTYLLTYGGALAALGYPFIGVLAYACLGILKPDYVWFWAVPMSNYSEVVALALLASWTFRGFGSWKFGAATPVVVFLLCYLSWMGLTAFFARYSWIAWMDTDIIAKIILIYIVGLTLIDGQEKLKQLSWTIVLTQAYTAFELNISYFRGYNKLWEEGFAYMDNNTYAISLVTCIPLAFFLGLSSKSWPVRLTAFAAAGLMTHAVFFSFSRGGILGLVVAGFVTFMMLPKRPVHYAMFVVALLVAIRLAGPEVRARFSTAFHSEDRLDEAASSRLALWKDCLTIMTESPVLGVGPGNWPWIADRFGWPRGKQAHSLWMQTGAESGLPGLFFLLGFYVICSLRLWRFVRQHKGSDEWEHVAARMVIASLSGFLVSSQFVSVYRMETNYYVALVGAGVLKLQEARVASRSTSPAEEPTFSGMAEGQA